MTVLGNNVKIKHGKKLSDVERLIASTLISATASLINEHADELTPEEKKAIGTIRTFSVVGPGLNSERLAAA